MPNSAVHMIAHGRVQGVGFRFFVREQATPLGITGWVKNLPDGTVEILAEGDENEVLDVFIDRIRKGPLFGRIAELTVEWREPTNSYTRFGITF